MKCRSKKEMSKPEAITMKNGRPATRGICPVCSTKMFRIGKSAWPSGLQLTRGPRFSRGLWLLPQVLVGLLSRFFVAYFRSGRTGAWLRAQHGPQG